MRKSNREKMFVGPSLAKAGTCRKILVRRAAFAFARPMAEQERRHYELTEKTIVRLLI